MMAQGWVTPGTRRTGLDIMLNFPSVHFIMVLLEIVYHVPPHSRKSRTKPVYFRLEKVRNVDTSDNFR